MDNCLTVRSAICEKRCGATITQLGPRHRQHMTGSWKEKSMKYQYGCSDARKLCTHLGKIADLTLALTFLYSLQGCGRLHNIIVSVKVLSRPRLDVLMPRLGFNVKTSKLRCDIIIHNVHRFTFLYVFKIFKTKLHLICA